MEDLAIRIRSLPVPFETRVELIPYLVKSIERRISTSAAVKLSVQSSTAPLLKVASLAHQKARATGVSSSAMLPGMIFIIFPSIVTTTDGKAQ